MELSVRDRLDIFAKYIGKHIWIENLAPSAANVPARHQCGILRGIKSDALLIATASGQNWMPLTEQYAYKLLLHPLSRLTEDITATANNLPAAGFISQYYVKLGFDMPVFIAPDHPENCKTVCELGLADYRSPREILELNYVQAEDQQTRML